MQVTAKDEFHCVVWCLSLCVCIMVLKMLYMYEHKRSQRAATHPKNYLYQGIENAVYMSVRNFQKKQKRARILKTTGKMLSLFKDNVCQVH